MRAAPEMGEIIMGTDGTIEITVGDDVHAADRLVVSRAAEGAAVRPRPARRRRQLSWRARRWWRPAARATPDPALTDDLNFTGKESFLEKEVKFARRWLTSKGVMVQEEQRNPVDTELESFFQNAAATGKRPRPTSKSAWPTRSR